MIDLPEIVKKDWGEEVIIYNGKEYCGKLLCFNEGTHGSLHYHLNKKESWYLNEGELEVTLINKETAEKKTVKMYKGETLTLEPGTAHQVNALKKSTIFEVSTLHDDNDTYRISKTLF